MIVLDENLDDESIKTGIMAWYPGQVTAVYILRSGSIVKDDVIPTLLHRVVRPTFVTINVTDFWKKVQPHDGYCIINVAVPQNHAHEVPNFLRRLFRVSDFKTKASRMGKIIRLTQNGIEYYERDRRIRSRSWHQ